MADYKSMYYYLMGRMASAIDTLDATTEALKATTNAFIVLKEKMKNGQRETEEMFISCEEDESDG